MKIIKAGNLETLAHRRFRCGVCGCEFEANAAEYSIVNGMQGVMLAKCECPTCGKEVYTRAAD